MRAPNRLFLWVLLIIVGALAIFFLLRRDTQAGFGPMVALCPGPDAYGYRCEPGTNFAYIDAREDTLLYQDDGMVTLALPFPFTFYGTTYTEIQASSNGTLHFGEAIPDFANLCLDDGPRANMGDMIAPFWDDLDLRFVGFLETAVVGEAPERIFVVEWDDVPRLGGDPLETTTFSVQLWEENDDIIFLYQDVTIIDSNRGRSATIGLQSAAQGLALQYSCNKPSVADAAGLSFPHPADPNRSLGLEVQVALSEQPPLAAKGPPAALLAALTKPQPETLTQLQSTWLAGQPALHADWVELDLTGNGRDELLAFWQGAERHPELTEIAVLAARDAADPELLLTQRLSTRAQPVHSITLVDTLDLTGDDVADALLADEITGALFAITQASGELTLMPVPGYCQGKLSVFDTDGDGLLEIVRDGCERAERLQVAWDGQAFVVVEK